MTPEEFGDAFDLAVPIRSDFYVLKRWTSKDEEKVQRSKANKFSEGTCLKGSKGTSYEVNNEKGRRNEPKTFFNRMDNLGPRKNLLKKTSSSMLLDIPPIVPDKTIIPVARKQRNIVPVNNSCFMFGGSFPTIIVTDTERPNTEPQTKPQTQKPTSVLEKTVEIGFLTTNSFINEIEKMLEASGSKLQAVGFPGKKEEITCNTNSTVEEILYPDKTKEQRSIPILIEEKNSIVDISKEDDTIQSKIGVSVNDSIETVENLIDENEFTILNPTNVGKASPTISTGNEAAIGSITKVVINSSTAAKPSLSLDRQDFDFKNAKDSNSKKCQNVTPFGLEIIIEDPEPISLKSSQSLSEERNFNKVIESHPSEIGSKDDYPAYNETDTESNSKTKMDSLNDNEEFHDVYESFQRNFSSLLPGVEIPEYLDPPNNVVTTPGVDETSYLLDPKKHTSKKHHKYRRSRSKKQMRQKLAFSSTSSLQSAEINTRIPFVKPVVYLRSAFLYLCHEIRHFWTCLNANHR